MVHAIDTGRILGVCEGVYESRRKRILRPHTTLECLFSRAGVIFITIYTYTKIVVLLITNGGRSVVGRRGFSSIGLFALFRSFSDARSLPAIGRARAHHKAEGGILRNYKFFAERCAIANVKLVSSSMHASSPPREPPSSACLQEGRRSRR